MNPGRVRIFYPADPAGVVPGGIDTFIRGIIKWAPPELAFSLVGMTTDSAARPVGRWTRCQIGAREYKFFPVVAVADAGQRGWLPLSLRFTLGAWRYRRQIKSGFDVFDFHRPEPGLLYLNDLRPKNEYFHQDPKTIVASASDNLWRRLPAGYERLEALAVQQLASAWCVRESGVETLRLRYPALADKVRFLPTWVDADVFHPADPANRIATREQLAQQFGVSAAARWVVFVGRLDTQKNPGLLVDAFANVIGRGRDAVLLLVGDGVLRRELKRQVHDAGLDDRVRFLGLRPQAGIARLLQAADLLALSSAYEGMPMALLEALGCGTPAITTDVGEVRRVVQSGSNGVVVAEHGVQAYADGLAHALVGAPAWREAALAAVAQYQPAQVLAPVYEHYLQLAQVPARLRQTAALQEQSATRASRLQDPVIGVPIDVKRGGAVVAQVMHWARDFESRGVCFCNAHSAVLATRDESPRLALLSADLVLADGAPVAWTLRRTGHTRQNRVDGPGTMWRVCVAARASGVRVGLYGSTPDVLQALQAELQRRLPGLVVAFAHSPPFRKATPEEDAALCNEIKQSRVGVLLVGLGCPKQEHWMAQQRGVIPAVMLGVGAAFDFHAGTLARAPRWMRRCGLEWLHRLGTEPGRLGWRYLSSNSSFIMQSLRDGLRTMGRQRPAPVHPRSIHFEASTHRSGATGATMNRAVDQRAIDDLVARVDAEMPDRRPRIVGFLSSSRGEGTSTLARAYAQTNAEAMGRSVLLLNSGQPENNRPSVIEALRDGERITEALSKRSRGLTEASLGVGPQGEPRRSAAWNHLAQPELWRALRDSFDLVVVDMKAADESDAALKVAPLCDGVVVVLEAARTRAPVVTQLLQNLNSVHARVLGTVLNKRRFHLPARLYRWL